MDRSATVSGRKAVSVGTGGPRSKLSSAILSRRLPNVVSRRGGHCRAALSDGGSQGASAALNPTLLGDAAAQMNFGEDPQERVAHGSAKGERERVDSGSVPQSSGSQSSSWDEWLQHFDTMDELAEDAAHYQVELDSAVKQERYGDAARHKRRLQEIQAADTVAAVQRQLQADLAAEDYGSAAELRDRGLVGLAGWWAGKDGPEDFSGHLLHVKPEFGRWTGRIYMARDIAALNGWRENALVQMLNRGSAADRGASGSGSGRGGSGSGSGAGKGLEARGAGLGSGTVGTPMMEVFLRQQDPAGGSQGAGAEGGAQEQLLLGALQRQATSSAQQQPQQHQRLVPGLLVHQAVALRPPGAGKKGGNGSSGNGSASGSGVPAVKLNPATVVRLSVHVAPDGSARISVLPPRPVRSEFNSREEEEMRATLAALASPGGKASDDGDDDDDEDYLTELTRIPAQVALQGRDRFTFTVLPDGATAAASTAAGASSSGGGGSANAPEASPSARGGALPRWAVPIDDDDEESDAAAAAQRRAPAAPPSRATAEARPLLGIADEVIAELEAGLGGASDDEADAREDSAISVSLDMLSTGYGRVDAVATSVSDGAEQRITIEIPVSSLMLGGGEQTDADEQRRSSGAAASTSSDAAPAAAAGRRRGKDAFDRLAERVAQLQSERAGRPVPPELLATALRALAKRLVEGELAADGSSSATATVPSPAAASAAKAAAAAAAAAVRASPLPRIPSASVSKQPSSSSSSPSSSSSGSHIAYARIPTDLPRSDPFYGLYLGAFGPHGPELVQLARAMQDGEEVVVASKVTGDPNVPAGEVSFRAKVGRRHRLDSRDVYPEEMGVMARYKGEGRVAMAGYKSPRWVDGELLVFRPGPSFFNTSAAELGFVWAVPGEKRFLILLNKLDLKECEK